MKPLKLKCMLVIRGSGHWWGLVVWLTPDCIEDLRNAGFQVDQITYTVPVWVNDLGLTKAWCVAQDLFNFRRPW